MYAWCKRCNGVFFQHERSQRFCSRTCAREFPFYGAMADTMDAKLRAVAERCYRFVIGYGTAKGVTTSDLVYRLGGNAFADLTADEKEFVQLWLSKKRDIAYMVSGDDWRFWPRHCAPEEANRA